ncbi:xanthine dehydrogenase accessory factor [Ancylobacter aquaticus]|uniref:Xanthine dehydrogenase accessory factor n=1 Tax=Ancylobacter aquaticus TaxID=100 RepID=A0A4R1I2H0_ANCAQ|nr:XdhC family protein [Ancylobacter aquaticus]TCK28141.1 xanthine dehydrogenase accessory factor [Ancylobacter aquaticus]
MQRPDGSWDPFADQVIDFALARLREGKRVAIVTLFSIDGAAPRQLGAQMAVTEAGEAVGYLSGGCLERAVITEAIEAMEAGANRLVRYGKDSQYLDIQLPCGSAIALYFDVTATIARLEKLEQAYLAREESTVEIGPAPGEQGLMLTRHYRPNRRLIVAGVGPAAAQLLLLGKVSGFETELLSPDAPTRAACARDGVLARPIHSTGHAEEFAADARTAFVLMFHDHEWEYEFLAAALASEAFYIGAQGSRMVHAARRQRLLNAGFSAAEVARIRGPAGLFHGTKSAHAIAVSILAEIMEAEQRQFPSLVSLDPPPVARRYSAARVTARDMRP